MVNKKGQSIFVLFMIAIAIIVLAIGLMKPATEIADGARNETDLLGGQGLNCTNPDLSEYDKGACGIIDITPFYFIGALIIIAGIIAKAKGFI